MFENETERFYICSMETKGERTRQFIIETAAPLLNKNGMAGTAISDIMAATKLAKGGIYTNFESKDEICLESFRFFAKEISAGLDQALAAKESPKEKLLACIDFYIENFIENYPGGCPLLNFGTEADDTNPVLASRVADAVNAIQARFYGLIYAGVAAGEFKASVRAETLATVMFSAIEGAMFVSHIKKENSQLQTVVDYLKMLIEDISI